MLDAQEETFWVWTVVYCKVAATVFKKVRHKQCQAVTADYPTLFKRESLSFDFIFDVVLP